MKTNSTQPKSSDWLQANQAYLMAALGLVRLRLQRALSLETASEEDLVAQEQQINQTHAALPAPAALETLSQMFRLSPFEQELLLLCAGMELDASFASLFVSLHGDPQKGYPTLSLALSVLPAPYWNALTPAAPLRRWKLVEIGPGKALTLSPLRIDERILHSLTGVQHLDERLMSLLRPVPGPEEPLVPSHQDLAEEIAVVWQQSSRTVVQLCGQDSTDRWAIAATVCDRLGLSLHSLSASALPTTPGDLHQLQVLWQREALLSQSALMLEWDLVHEDAAKTAALAQFIDTLDSPLLISSLERQPARQRPLISFDVRPPTTEEQRQLWQTVLRSDAATMNGHVHHLTSQFSFSSQGIHTAYLRARGQWTKVATSPEDRFQSLWQSCCMQSRPRLEDLAQRLDPAASWEDLVLPEAQRQTLRTLAAHVRQRARVYTQWGFAAKSHRGLGISALFSGPSGTGKTTAAEVLARELQLDLYRIDLSAVVSKYIGETEKNLRRIFDAAEAGGVVLLFDEADALFGKRSDVKDSHDRYANMEVSYLLQRIEAYQGLAILTTNLKPAIDTAFVRRIRFIVQFAFPDATQRAEIWRRVFPRETPVEGLDYKKLAKLSVAGGNIRNIALNAAFIAADAGDPVRMEHLLQAAQSEYVKLERPLTDAEVKGWV